MRLPGGVQELADVIGRERALYLVGQLPRYYAGRDGGKCWRVVLYVPTLARMGVNHELVRLMGWNDAERLCRAFGGEILQLANCTEIYRRFRDKSALRLLEQGWRAIQVAEALQVSERHVRNLVRENPHKENYQAANDNQRITIGTVERV